MRDQNGTFKRQILAPLLFGGFHGSTKATFLRCKEKNLVTVYFGQERHSNN